MGSKRFLITGATGRTGGETARCLLERGYPVRAFVHQEDERSAQLQARGAEIVVGDLHDFMTVRQALEGVAGAYFVYPDDPGIVEATAYFAQAAKEANCQPLCTCRKFRRAEKRRVTTRSITG